jgi:general stress protein YciG
MTTKATEAARLLGRKGGKARAKAVDEKQRIDWSKKGGYAVAAKYTPEERSERARAAARARWDARRRVSVDSQK